MTEAKESNGGALMQSPSPNHSEEIEYNPLYENLSNEIHKKRLEKKCRFGKKYSWEIAREILKKQGGRNLPIIKDGEQSYSELQLEEIRTNFGFEQRKMDYEAGDKILREFIVDKAWSMKESEDFINFHRWRKHQHRIMLKKEAVVTNYSLRKIRSKNDVQMKESTDFINLDRLKK